MSASAVPSPSPSAPTPAKASPRPPTSLREPLVQGLTVLTVTTGLVDAASYLGLGHVFAANMTGNIVLLGFGLAKAGGLPVVAPLLALVAFLAGATVAGRMAGRLARPHHLRAAVAAETVLVAAAAALAGVIHVRTGHLSGDIVIALLALGMGVRNATIRRLAVPDMTTTVLTLTLTGLAADSPLAGGKGSGSLRRATAVAAMLAGALAGALLLKTSLTLVLAVAAALCAGSLLVYRLGGASSIRPR